jgi:hypothetical protein
LATGVLALCAAGAGADAPSPWIHVRVEEPQKQSKVHLNLPLPVVEAAIKAAPDSICSKGKLAFGNQHPGLSVVDLRKAWVELKAAGDTDLVTVEDNDENVKIGRKGELVTIHVTKQGREKEEVSIEVPVAVLDALFSGEGDELNVKGALFELQKRRGDIVRVNDANTTVRVWIDEKN